MSETKTTMEFNDAAEIIASHTLNIDSETESVEEAEEARLLAFHALKQASETIIRIRMNDAFHVDFAEKIGMVMNNDDVSKDINGQRYYSIHALFHAAASMAKAMIDDGYELDQVMGFIMDSLKHSLQETLGIQIEVGGPTEEGIAAIFEAQSKKNSNLPS